MRVAFSCPYSAELPEPDGGCSHDDPWQADATESTNVEDALEVGERDAACPRCGRVGVADSEQAVVIVAQRED